MIVIVKLVFPQQQSRKADKNKFNGAAAEIGDDSVFEDTIHYSIDTYLGGRQRQTVARGGARAVTVIPSPTFKVSSKVIYSNTSNNNETDHTVASIAGTV